jgi:hypothetical protein
MNLTAEFLHTFQLPVVEKDGTGIDPADPAGRRPLENIAAEIAQEVFVEHGSSRCRGVAWSIFRPRAGGYNLALI